VGRGGRSVADNLKRAAKKRALSYHQVAALAESVGLPGKTFAQIAKGESAYQVGAVGHDPGGTKGYGLWQITTKYNDDIIKRFGGAKKLLTDPVANAKAAKAIYDRQGIGAWYGTKYMTSPNAHYKGPGKPPRGGDSVQLEDVDIRQEKEFDPLGFQQAQKEYAVNRLLTARKGPEGTVMQRVGLLQGAAPDRGDFTRTRTTSEVVPGRSVRLPGVTDEGGGPRGRVSIAGGADRAGTPTRSLVKQFLERASGHAGTGITVTTGTNHNRLTVNGNVSDHWDGNAADIGVPVDSRKGDRIAAGALIAAGVPPKKAKKMARQGGLFNINHKGRRIQVIWKTMDGGNHHDHVHVGIS
jgi:hypothetical protein